MQKETLRERMAFEDETRRQSALLLKHLQEQYNDATQYTGQDGYVYSINNADCWLDARRHLNGLLNSGGLFLGLPVLTKSSN